MKTRILLLINFLFLIVQLSAQTPYPGCPNVSQEPEDPELEVKNDTVLLNCEQKCAVIEANFLETGLTDDYKVESIDYSPPFPFRGGTALFVDEDDVYSDVINLPFKFCFYGNTYDQVVVGANGLLSFNVGLAGDMNCYQIDNPIPNATDANCALLSGNGNMRHNSIYGPFLDLDPRVDTKNPSINYAILGTFPCRTFVLNYTDVGQFSCENLYSTQQIVLYETTNVIEVYVKDRKVCSGWNDGNAVIGIQNVNGSKAVAPPGRNTGAWTASNEAWRFTPQGAPNYTIAWYDEDGNFVTSNPKFEVCTSDDDLSAKYKVEVTYSRCDGVDIVVEDEVVVVAKEPLSADFTFINSRCYGTCEGSVEVDILTGEAPYTYFWPAGQSTENKVDTFCAGNYSLLVKDKYGCEASFDFEVVDPPELVTDISSEDVSCYQLKDGLGIVEAEGGIAPYSYNWSNGQTNDTLIDGAGTYIVTVSDANNCTKNDTVEIIEPDLLVFDTVLTHLSCPEAEDGEIEFIASGGNPPYEYSIDNGINYQSQNIFRNLQRGTYSLKVKDDKDCEYSYDVTLKSDSISLIPPNDTSVCPGESVTLTAKGYFVNVKWDNGVFNGNPFVPNHTGDKTYKVTVENVGGCKLDAEVIVNVADVKSADIKLIGPFCLGDGVTEIPREDEGGVWTGNGVDADGMFDPLIAGSGIHEITYSFDGPCPDADTIYVQVNSAFEADIDAVEPLCGLESAFELTSVTPGGKWWGPGIDEGTDSTSAIFDPGMAGEGIHRVYHLIEGSCGELDSTDIEVIKIDYAVIDALPEFCPTGAMQDLSASPVGGTWTGSGIVDNAAGTFDPLVTGSGSFEVVYTPSGNCFVRDTAFVLVVDTLVGSGDTTLLDCNGDTDGELSVTVSGGKQPYVYAWDNGVTANETASDLSAGDYTTTVIDDLGCQITLNSQVQEPTALQIDNFQIVDDSCYQSGTGWIDIDVSGGSLASGDYVYTISPSAGTDMGSGLILNFGAGTYNIRISDDSLCSINQDFTIDEPAEIQTSSITFTAYCQLPNGSAKITSITGGTAPYDILWETGAITDSIGDLYPDPQSYDYTITDAHNCVHQASVTVPNSGGATLQVSQDSVICNGDNTGKAMVEATGGETPYNYEWTNAGGAVLQSLNGTTLTNDTLENLSAGTYFIEVEDNTGCSNKQQIIVREPTAVVLTQVSDSILCQSQVYNVTLEATGGTVGSNGIYSFTSNGEAVSGNVYSTDKDSIADIQAFDKYGCPSNVDRIVISYLDSLSLVIPPIDSICPGFSVNYSVTPQGGRSTGYSVEWETGETTNAITYQSTQEEGIETIWVKLNDGCSPEYVDTAKIYIYSVNEVAIDIDTTEGCEPLVVTYELLDKSTKNIQWDFGNGETAQEGHIQAQLYAVPGNYYPRVSAQTEQGCQIGADLDTINVYKVPEGEIIQSPREDDLTIINTKAVFKVESNPAAKEVDWTLMQDSLLEAVGTGNPWEYNFPGEVMSYDLEAVIRTDKGCSAILNKPVQVNWASAFYVPKAFTPNGDGVNDYFSVENIGNDPSSFSIVITNKWGEVLFESNDFKFKWDGIYNYEPILTGTYFWRIRYVTYFGEEIIENGTVLSLD